jgi:hypothetical protein
MGVSGSRFKHNAKGSGIKITANEKSLASVLFEGANISLAERLFGVTVSVPA